MLRSIRELIGYPVRALDGKMGKVVDCLFGDRQWRLRYVALNNTTGFHLNVRHTPPEDEAMKHRIVLVAPEHLERPELGSDHRRFPVHLTKDELERAPSIHAHEPMETQLSEELTNYLRHEPYGGRPRSYGPLAPIDYLLPEPREAIEERDLEAHRHRVEEISKVHLHSAKEILGYKVRAIDGEVGSVHDFILDDQAWVLRHLIVDCGHWPVGRKHIVNIKKIERLDWSNRRVEVGLSKKEVESTPRFDPHTPVNRDQQMQRYDYYGKPIKADP